MVPGDEDGFGVAGEEEIENHHWDDHRGDQGPHRPVEEPFERGIEDQSEEGGDAVVDRPDGEQEITRFTVVGIAAARTAIERSKPIAEGARAGHAGKHRALAADGALQYHGMPQIRTRFRPIRLALHGPLHTPQPDEGQRTCRTKEGVAARMTRGVVQCFSPATKTAMRCRAILICSKEVA